MTEQHEYDNEQDLVPTPSDDAEFQHHLAHAVPAVPQADEVAATETDAAETPAPSPLTEPAPAPASIPVQNSRSFVRPRAPHRTQEAIDDLAHDGHPETMYAHDSNIAISGGAFSGREYRRSRNGMDKVQSGRYGQYLEIPKGRRSIFASRERRRRRRSLIAAFLVIAFLAIVAFIIWKLIQQL